MDPRMGKITVHEAKNGFQVTYPTLESRHSFEIPKPTRPAPPFGESFAIPPVDYAALMDAVQKHLAG